ncbi:C-type lectin domain family 10 member A-like [Mercenaria mercenaria]|uniref:C-type lectin domain family 10 member A-like n=1 Tax=Mercenaria mercenaria TaxID=6596 RepID=UPI00234E87A1|nr:C-type lectin domain family 10 member A-like [Mercenaria mercenaria]
MLMNIETVVTLFLIFGFNATAGTDCLNNWTAHGNSCYLFGHQSLPFYTAEHYCRQHNGHLVHINGKEENVFIREHLRYMKGIRWWIGLTDDDVEGTWMWYDTNEEAMYTDWTPGQPTNSGNNEDCVEFDMTAGYDGHWNDAPCDMHLLPICERSSGNIDIVG